MSDKKDKQRTGAEGLFADARVAEAKRLLREALAEHQGKLAEPRQPDPRLAENYERMLDRFAQVRGGALHYPYLGSGLGRGALVELADGSIKYDMISGIGVYAFGHSDAGLMEAGVDAALRSTFMQGNLQQNAESLALSERLLDLAKRGGAKLDHCFLSTSGAMANENALKILFQKRHPADRVLAFDDCFMGRTLVMSRITDRAGGRGGLPATLAVDYVPFFDPADADGSTRRAVAALERHIARHPDRHAAMCFELVQGEGGFKVGDRRFFLALIEVLRRHDIPMMIDEIQTFGRLPDPFAFAHFRLGEHADVVTVGKLTQVCATLFTADMKPRPGLLSQTFTGAAAAILGGLAMVERLTDGNFYGPNGRIEAIHRRFAERLGKIAEHHPGWVTGPFGLGGMIAFTAFEGDLETTKKLLAALFEAGVIAFYAGDKPTRVRFLPPIGAVTDEQIDDVCRILEQTLEDVVTP